MGMLEAAIERNRAKWHRVRQLQAVRHGIHLNHFNYVDADALDAGKTSKASRVDRAERIIIRINKRIAGAERRKARQA